MEISPARTEGIAFFVDDNKNLEIKKNWESLDPRGFSYWLKKNNCYKLIISVDHSLGASVFLPLKWERGLYSQKTLTLVELENFIFQEVGKTFKYCQGEAAEKLKINHSDAIMVGWLTRGFRIDGYKVIDPVDFPAKKVEIILELVFVNRYVFEKWGEALTDSVFWTENGRAAISILGKGKKSPASLLIFDFKESFLLSFDDRKSISSFFSRSTISWGINNLIESIANHFGVDKKIAQRIYDIYLCGEMSPKLLRKLNQILKSSYSFLRKELTKNRLKGEVFSVRNFNLPIFFPSRKIILKDISYLSLLEDFGFKINLSKKFKKKENLWFKPLKFAPFLEFYYYQENLFPIDLKLRRYLCWLNQGGSVK